MKALERFLHTEVLASLALALGTLAAILLANSSFSASYLSLIDIPVAFEFGQARLGKPLSLWINDGLMAVFFLLVALELKREVLEGELSSIRQVVLPLAGAIGGIVLPAFLYILITGADKTLLQGWAIPIATDIAFALGVLSIFGRRVPNGLKTFLLTLAVFDDLGAILIIAFVYTGNISWTAQIFAFVCFLILLGFNKFGVTKILPYFLIGAIMWLCVLKSGVHATLAGVLLGLTIPLRANNEAGKSPLHQLEHALHPWVAFLILPIFAFANAGVSFAGVTLDYIFQPLTLGILVALPIGKCIGVFFASALLIRLGFAKLPQGVNYYSFLGVALVSGIGFTMSLFIGTLAFEQNWSEFGPQVRLGVFLGSLIAFILGGLVLHVSLGEAVEQTPTASE